MCMGGCSAGEQLSINGLLVYTNGGKSINSIDLSTPDYTYSTIYRNDDISSINHLEVKDGNVILINECNFKGECSIKEYSLKSKNIKLLHTGIFPSYISTYNKLFFYDRDRTVDNRYRLYVTPISSENKITMIAYEPKWQTLPNGIRQPTLVAPIGISKNEVLFVGEHKNLSLYNILNSKTSVTGIENCRPMLWISKQNKLLCSNWDTWNMFLLNLKNKNIINIQELNGAYGFVYIPNIDALVYCRTQPNILGGESYNIYLYLFSNNKEKLIRKNSRLISGVWLDRME